MYSCQRKRRVSDQHTIYKHLLHRGPRGARTCAAAAAAATCAATCAAATCAATCAAAAAAVTCTCAAAARLRKRGRAARPVALTARQRVVVQVEGLEARQPREQRQRLLLEQVGRQVERLGDVGMQAGGMGL